MNFLMNDSLIKAVSWTLIHSLWLGLATAVLAAMTLLFTKKATSATRYNLLAGLSVAFLVTIGFIFYNEFETQVTVLQTDKLVKSNLGTEQFVSVSPAVIREEASSPFSMITSFISNYASCQVQLSNMSLQNLAPQCMAVTPTGADQSGSRSII